MIKLILKPLDCLLGTIGRVSFAYKKADINIGV